MSGSGTTSVSATATATSTATDLRPVIAAAAVAAELSAQDQQTGILSSSILIGAILGAVGLWVLGIGFYRFIKKKRVTAKSPIRAPNSTKNPMFISSPILHPKPNSNMTLPEQKPAILSISANKKIISGVLQPPVYVQSIQFRPQPMTNLHERRDFQVFQATTVRNMRATSRPRQLKREE